MMTKTRSTVKSDKGEARALAGAVKRALEAGDYLLVRKMNCKIMELSPDSDLGAEAASLNAHLEFDPFLARFALGAWAIYLIGWGVGLGLF